MDTIVKKILSLTTSTVNLRLFNTNTLPMRFKAQQLYGDFQQIQQ